jgi:YVTN family beta-propeller protein
MSRHVSRHTGLEIAVLWIAFAVSVNAAGSGTLLVLNKSDNTVSLIDLASKESIATISTGVGPHEVAVSPDGKIAAVANYGNRARPGNTLTVIDVPAGKPLRTIDLGENRRPHGITWLEANEVAVTTEGSKALLVVDVGSAKLAKTVPTDQEGSHMVAVAPKLRRAFVANIGSGSVSIVDLKENRRIANIPTGDGAEGIDISPDQAEVWVANRAVNTVSVIDAASLKIIATLPCKDFPIRVKFTADGERVLVSNAGSGDVAVFDAAQRQEVRRISMQVKASEQSSTSDRLFSTRFGQSPVPVGILIAPELNQAFVANTNADVVIVIDLKTWQIADRLTAGNEPDGLGYSPLSLRKDGAGDTVE